MAARIITQSQVKSQLNYCPETGVFRRTVDYKSTRKGDIAGYASPYSGYVFVSVLGMQCRAHRLAYIYMMGDCLGPHEEIDHKNGLRSDNRWGNLRIVTSSQNKMNVDIRADNKSGCRGVSLRRDTGKWHARIVVGGSTILLGNFDELSDAIAARRAAEPIYHGEFVRIPK